LTAKDSKLSPVERDILKLYLKKLYPNPSGAREKEIFTL